MRRLPPGWSAQPQRDAGVVEVDLFGVEPDQANVADPACGEQQQQGAVTQAGPIARAGGCRRSRCAAVGGRRRGMWTTGLA